MSTLGYDVSHHQGRVDHVAMAEGGFTFCYARMTIGTTGTDERAAENRRAIRDAGLIRGLYHVCSGGSAPATQAQHFVDVAKPRPDDFLVFDIERGTPDLWPGKSAAEILDINRQIVRHVTELVPGNARFVYTGSFWRDDMGNPDDDLGCRLILAAYVTGDPNRFRPRAWDEIAIHQFTDGQLPTKHSVPGVRGNCDQDRYLLGDAKHFRRLVDRGVGRSSTNPQKE
jgi:GH25 family lysozyme M1 (1,4-beta-N-acetylmuramidase)